MNVSFEDEVLRLNTDQRRAVETIDGPVLVIAGPGTGKTQVLSLRIANILKQGSADASSILCLTFQEASVVAMKNRLNNFIGNEAFKVNVHTFHSFCNEIIKTFPSEFDYTSEVEPIKEIDKLTIFKEILTTHKLHSLQYRNNVLGYFRAIQSAISTLKKEFISPQKLLDLINAYQNSLDAKELNLNARKIEKMRELQQFYTQYLLQMQDKNLIDFDDMIYKVTEKFTSSDEFVKFFQEQFLYTLVDEFQDTNNAQLEIIKSIASFEGLTANVFAVGDDDQTIFRFQGAKSENFTRFLEIFPESKLIVLHTNYRSTQNIIDVSTNLIENNPNRITSFELAQVQKIDKYFEAFNKDLKIPVESHEFEHSFHEDFWMGDKIRDLISSGIKPNEIAIICRVNRQIVNLTSFLNKFEIKYNIKRSESVLNNNLIQNIILMLQVIASPIRLKEDKLIWKVLTLPFFKIDDFEIFELYHKASTRKVSIYEFIRSLDSSLAENTEFNKIRTIFNKIQALQIYSAKNSLQGLYTNLIKQFELIKFLEEEGDAYADLNRLSTLYEFISSRSRFKSNYTLDDFLSEIKLMEEKNILIPIDEIDLDEETKVNLITAHSSKGLEFEYVFIYQTVESKWEKYRGGNEAELIPPITKSSEISGDDEDLIDERRLFYVAMTRAKKGLYLTYSKKYFDSDTGELDNKEKMPSRFLLESNISQNFIHSDLINKHDEIVKLLLQSEDPVKIPETKKEYLSHLVSNNLNLSATRMHKYQKCHYKFLLEEIFRLPIPKEISFIVGSAVHKGVEILTKTYQRDKKLPDLDFVLKVADEEFERGLEEIDLEDSQADPEFARKDVAKSVSTYYKHFTNNLENIERTEFFTLGNFEGIKVTGRIDKISRNESELIIADYKTTSKFPSITEFLGLTLFADKAHLQQLMFYRLLMESSLNFALKKVAPQISRLKIEYINAKEEKVNVIEIPARGIFQYKQRSNSKKFNDFDIDQEYLSFKNNLKEVFASVKGLNFQKTENRRECQNCPFKQHCGR